MDKEVSIPIWLIVLIAVIVISLFKILLAMAFCSDSDNYQPPTKEELDRGGDIEDQYPASGFGNHTDPPSLR